LETKRRFADSAVSGCLSYEDLFRFPDVFTKLFLGNWAEGKLEATLIVSGQLLSKFPAMTTFVTTVAKDVIPPNRKAS